jgi:hypothetical protein
MAVAMDESTISQAFPNSHHASPLYMALQHTSKQPIERYGNRHARITERRMDIPSR